MPEVTGVYLLLFLAVVGFCVSSWVLAVGWTAPTGRKWTYGALALAAALAWVALTSTPVGLGWVTVENPIPGAPIQVALIFLVAFAIALSPLGRRLGTLPMWALVGFQGMRFPLEVVLHGWADQGVAPPQMAFTGQNFDIVAGLLCLVLAPFADRSRVVAWISQGVGIALLVNVMRVVLFSMPTPLRSFEDVLLLPFHIPTLWIATVCVLMAWMVHAVTVRRLLSRMNG
ncbi:MAG: hypothetical protein AB8H79_26860 [Myxococcota bacterium]